MNNTLKIQIPEGFKIDSFDVESGEVKFAPIPKDIKERIKTFADVLQYHKIDEKTFEDTCTGLTIDEIAYKKIKLFVEALNEGWIPDWQNDNQWKYFPWFDFDDSSSAGRFSFCGSDTRNSDSLVGSRLCFKTRELSNYAGKQFEYIYRDFLTIK